MSSSSKLSLAEENRSGKPSGSLKQEPSVVSEGRAKSMSEEHILHSELLAKLNAEHSFSQDQYGSSIGRLRFLSGNKFLAKSHSFTSTLVQFLNQQAKHIDLKLSDRLRDFRDLVSHKLASLGDSIASESAHLSRDYNDKVNKLEIKHSRELESLSQQIAEMKVSLAKLESMGSGLERIVSKISEQQASLRVSSKTQSNSEGKVSLSESDEGDYLEGRWDYLLFENRFRGSEELVEKRLEFYLEHLRDLPGKLLEVGCGRGELLSLCAKNSIDAYGYEIDGGMVEHCSGVSGIEVEFGDGIKHLESLEDNSLGGLIATQVVEHLPLDTLRGFVKAAAKKVSPGGVVIFETINPGSLVALSQHYFRDPTHVSPLHPETLSFLMNIDGDFSSVDSHYLSLFEEGASLRPIESDWSMTPKFQFAVQQMNDNVAKLNSLLFGAADYAVIAKVS